MTAAKRWLTFALIALAVLVGAGAVGLNFATRTLKAKVEQALGAQSEIGEIVLGWHAVEVRGLRIRGPKGWPAEDALRAERIVIEPQLASIFSERVQISAIRVDKAYLSALRAADGRMRLLPSLLEDKAATDKGAAPAVTLDAVELRDAAIEFFDATVRKPPLKLRLESIQATVTDIELPALAARSRIHLDGTLKGAHHDGKIAVDGWMTLASRDSEIGLKLHGADLTALQPYLIKAAETGVKKGSLDLDLQSAVKAKHLRAPGAINLKGLELESGSGTFLGMPRQAVVGLMKDKAGNIAVKFVLEGNLDDPKFQLNENLSTRFAAAVADTLGISVESLAKGVGELGQKSGKALSDVTKGAGEKLKGLFGN